MSVVITTDASKKGFGSFMNEQIFQGNWTHAQSKCHINCLEMEAVFLTMKHFLTQIKDQAVLIRSDNTTVVQYINKQGGTKSPQLCYQVWDLWNMAIQNNIQLKAGKLNILTDQLSRTKILPTEWSLNSRVVQNLFSNLGSTLDRFICIGTQSTDRDILLLESSYGSFGSGCLVNLLGENVCFCIPPNMPDSSSDTIHEAIPLSDFTGPGDIDSSSNPVTNISGITLSTQNLDLPSEPTSIQSDGMASINKCYESERFSEEARKLLSASWRKGTQKDYCSKFKQFNSWCCSRQIDPNSISLSQIADFLTYLYIEKGLQYRTIAGYRSMLSTVLPTVDNFPIGQHPHIIWLIKGVFNSRPPVKKSLPEWDLHIVLNMLENSPFEPLEQISLKKLTFKTVFLTAITTFRRCSDLQALRIDEHLMRIQNKELHLLDMVLLN